MSLWSRFVAWCKGEPSPNYTEESIQKWANEQRIREAALTKATARLGDPLYEESREDRQKDDERTWPEELEAGWPEAEGVHEIEEWYKKHGRPTITVSTDYNWGKTIDIPKGDFDCILNGPYFKLGYPDKPPLKRSRKPKVAKAPKKGTIPPKKGKTATKARSVRKKPGVRTKR